MSACEASDFGNPGSPVFQGGFHVTLQCMRVAIDLTDPVSYAMSVKVDRSQL